MNPLTRLRYEKHNEITHPKALAPRNAQANRNAHSQFAEEKITKLLIDGFCATDIARFLNISVERVHKVELDQETTPRKISSLTTTLLVWSKEN